VCRVAMMCRVMREGGVQRVSPRKSTRTTLRVGQGPSAPNFADRDRTATGPNHLWVADITYIPPRTGSSDRLYVVDIWNRRVVGWAMATHLRTELALGALDMALKHRKP